jgi:hypothetical protein
MDLKKAGSLFGALALAALSVSCAGDIAGYALVTQDKYDFMECKEIVTNRTGLLAREKQLAALIEKAEASPGGIIISAGSYRSEMISVQTSLRVLNKAAQQKGCEPAKP